jgi:hypothetical protein
VPDANVSFEPYSLARESELGQGESNLLACYYNGVKRAGNWLIVTNAVRPYCRPYGCFQWTPSVLFFLFYLLTHPSLTTLPWLAGFLLTGATLVYLSSLLIQKRPDLSAATLIVLAAAALFFIIQPAWLLGLITGWVLFCYGLALGYKYIKGNV